MACAGLATSAAAVPVQWAAADGGNDHWYDFVILSNAVSATEAEAAAEASMLNGENGYLATITSAAEQVFLNTLWPGAGSVTGQFNGLSFFLIGASDRDSEGTFKWIGGPEEGDTVSYTNWNSGEPNDLGGEDYAVGWWNDSVNGVWNDTQVNANYFAYLVEYNDAAVAPAVPLPAAGWMLLAGVGGLAAMRRRRKT